MTICHIIIPCKELHWKGEEQQYVRCYVCIVDVSCVFGWTPETVHRMGEENYVSLTGWSISTKHQWWAVHILKQQGLFFHILAPSVLC